MSDTQKQDSLMRILLFLLVFISSTSFAQEAMEVQRCADIDRYSPIRNIYVDNNQNKWVADEQGLFLAQSPDYANTVETPSNEWSLLSVPGGNQELNLPKNQLSEMMGDDFNKITAAHLDKTRDELLIGTKNNGIYRFKIKPNLQQISHWTTSNSKLKSNTIQAITSTPNGKLYVGTDNGMLEVKGGDNKLIVKYFNIEAITQFDGKIWVIGDQDILEMDSKGRLYSLEAEKGMTEGDLKDIEFDSQGRLWIASEIISRYSFEAETFDRFGPAEDFTSQYVNCIAIDQDDALWVGTDDKGVYFIGKASTMSASMVLTSELGCDASAKNAAIQVRASGGEPPYEYQWEGGVLSGDNPKNLGPGKYVVTIVDKKGKTAKSQIEIEDPSIKVTINEDRPASPGGDADGIATIGVSGGKPDYKFIWDNAEKGQTAKRLKAGPHKVTVTDQAGCSTVGNITITSSLAELAMTVEPADLIKCNGVANGSIRAIVTGGKKPYQYQFPAGNTRNEVAQNLPAGEYVVTVTDATGSTITAKTTLEQPDKIAAFTKVSAPANMGKSDGKATAEAKGGTPPYQFKWDTGENTQEASKLAAGKHLVTITDANGCAITSSTIISEDILPLNVILTMQKELKCAADETATLTAEVNGGKGPFEYNWNTSKGNNNQATNLGAGNYELTVSDATGAKASVKMSIQAPQAITLTAVVKASANTNQSDGKASVKANGGTGKFSYKWDSGETQENASKLNAGDHTVTVTDANGCSATATVEISEDILPLNVTLSSKSTLKCEGDESATIIAEINGGKGPFEYKWSTAKGSNDQATGLAAGDYSLTVSDATGATSTAKMSVDAPEKITVSATAKASANTNQADGKASVKAKGGAGKYTYKWDNGETKDDAKRLAAGKHVVTVTDKNGCSATAEVNITEDILPLSVDIQSTKDINCAGESTASLKAEVNGGKSPFQYQWSTDKGKETTADNLGAGDYQLTVTDAAGTTSSAKFTVKSPTALTGSISVLAPATTNSADGKALAKVSGGTAPYQYKWDTGEQAEKAEKLGAGNRSVTVTDSKGCTAVANVEISEDIQPLLVDIQAGDNIKCAGQNTASLTASASGGKSPYTYQWSGGNNTESINNLAAGIYEVTVNDVAGSTKTASFEVKAPAALSVVIEKNRPTTNADTKDGRASLTINGGTKPYTYNWDSGETTEKAEKLTFGSHSVTVSDANGCSASLEFETKKKIMPALTAGRMRTGQTLQVSNLFFQADSTDMTPDSYPALDEIVDFLEESPTVVIEVGGHTNDVPPHDYCDALSTARAKSVANYITQKGVDPNRVFHKGYGKRKPKFSNRTADGRKKNQRVEIKILRLQ